MKPISALTSIERKHEADLKPEVLADQIRTMRREAVDKSRATYEEAAALIQEVEANADQFDRGAILRDAPVTSPPKAQDGLSPDTRAVIAALRDNTEAVMRFSLQGRTRHRN